MNDPNQSYVGHSGPMVLQGAFLHYNTPLPNQIIPNWPTRLPFTLYMLGRMLQRLTTGPQRKHDPLMFKAALTLGLFGLLRPSGTRDSTLGYITRQDISWSREGIALFHQLINN